MEMRQQGGIYSLNDVTFCSPRCVYTFLGWIVDEFGVEIVAPSPSPSPSPPSHDAPVDAPVVGKSGFVYDLRPLASAFWGDHEPKPSYLSSDADTPPAAPAAHVVGTSAVAPDGTQYPIIIGSETTPGQLVTNNMRQWWFDHPEQNPFYQMAHGIVPTAEDDQAAADEHQAAMQAEAQVERDYADYVTVLSQVQADTDTCGPHCDQFVLHVKGICLSCDSLGFQPLHDARERLHIAHTGEKPGLGQRPCPAEVLRPLATIEQWHGNWASSVR